MKVAAQKDIEGDYSNLLLGYHNLRFLSKKLGIKTPNTGFFIEKNGVFYKDSMAYQKPLLQFLGSGIIPGFMPYSKIMKNTRKLIIKRLHDERQKLSVPLSESSILEITQHIQREQLVSKIGEEGLAQLAVAGTMIQDLLSNDGNWGCDASGLVIVDADRSPKTLDEFLRLGREISRTFPVAITLEDLSRMQIIYQNLLETKQLHTDLSVDVEPTVYWQTISSHLGAVSRTIDNAKSIGVGEDVLDPRINEFLAQNFQHAYLDMELNSEYLKELKKKKKAL